MGCPGAVCALCLLAKIQLRDKRTAATLRLPLGGGSARKQPEGDQQETNSNSNNIIRLIFYFRRCVAGSKTVNQLEVIMLM